MGAVAYKVKMEFTKLDGFDAGELWDLFLGQEPNGKLGEASFLYVIDSEEIAERLGDSDYEFTPRERELLQALKDIADQEGGAFDLCLE